MLPFDEEYSEEVDSELIKHVCDGSGEALAVLLSFHERFIYNVAVFVLRKEDDAKLFTTEILLKVFLNLRSIPYGVSFRSWLYTRTISELRKKFPKEDIGIVIRPDGKMVNGTDKNEDVLFAGGIGNIPDTCLNRALFSLPISRRIIFILGGVFSITNQKVAEMTGVTEEKVVQEIEDAEYSMLDFLRQRCSAFKDDMQCTCYTESLKKETREERASIENILASKDASRSGDRGLIGQFRKQPYVNINLVKELLAIVTFMPQKNKDTVYK